MTHTKDEALKLALEALTPMQNSRDDTAVERAITAIKQALAAPTVQEPWGYGRMSWGEKMFLPTLPSVRDGGWMALYTTPPAAQPAVPITESEIEKMWFQQADFPTAGQRIVGFARAIEAKLKEKNSD